jgi:hypothetical protein
MGVSISPRYSGVVLVVHPLHRHWKFGQFLSAARHGIYPVHGIYLAHDPGLAQSPSTISSERIPQGDARRPPRHLATHPSSASPHAAERSREMSGSAAGAGPLPRRSVAAGPALPAGFRYAPAVLSRHLSGRTLPCCRRRVWVPATRRMTRGLGCGDAWWRADSPG